MISRKNKSCTIRFFIFTSSFLEFVLRHIFSSSQDLLLKLVYNLSVLMFEPQFDLNHRTRQRSSPWEIIQVAKK